MDEQELERLDSVGYVVLDAITYGGPPPNSQTHASPHRFVCINGNTYWIKRKAQQGLVAELVAGRLGTIVGAAPAADIVRVIDEVTPSDGSADHLLGVGVGIRNEPGMENLRELGHLVPSGMLDPKNLDLPSRVRVLAFQTWLGVDDTQILVDLRTGRLASIDHGAWGANPTDRSDPVIVPTPGVPPDFGRDRQQVETAVARIRAVSDEEILRAVARVPGGGDWNAERGHRLALAEWIAFRRGRLAEVMRAWRRSR